MKVVINGKAFVKKYKTGVQRYCIELLNEIDKQVSGTEIELLIPKYCNEEFTYKNIKVVKFGNLNLNIWEQIELPLYAYRNKAILVNLCNTSPIKEVVYIANNGKEFIQKIEEINNTDTKELEKRLEKQKEIIEKYNSMEMIEKILK